MVRKKTKEQCIIKNCDKKQYAAKLCTRHYKIEFDENKKMFGEPPVK